MSEMMLSTPIKVEMKAIDIKQEHGGDIVDESHIYKFPGRSKSSVWNHFGFQKGPDGLLDKSKAVCKICYQGIRYSGNTTNLHCHLNKHRKQGEVVVHSPPTFDPVVVQSTVGDIKQEQIQSTSMDEYRTDQRSKHQQLNDTIVNFFIEHLLPLSIVESTSFYSMIAVADPMYVVPDKDYLYGQLVQQSYNEVKQSIEAEISGNEVIISTEFWESITGVKFVSISCQLINTQWIMRSFLLKTVSMGCIQNDLQFIALLQGTYKEWGIDRPIGLVNDGSKLLENVFQSPSVTTVNIPFCRKVFFAAGNDLTTNLSSKKLVEFIISMIGVILQSKSPSELYQKVLIIVKDYKEINQTTLCWTTFSEIISCVIEHKETIMKNVFDEETFSEERWKEMEEIAEIASPLLKAYNLFSGHKNVVSSMVLPVIKKLDNVLTKKKRDLELTKTLKRATWLSVTEPFQKPDLRNFLLISSLLDPRYKELQFVDVPERARARDILSTVATELYRENHGKNDKQNGCSSEVIVLEESGDVIRIEPMAKRPKLATDTDDWLADVVSKSKNIENSTDKEEKVMIEIDHYLSAQQSSTMPLEWWAKRENIYPVLSRLARRYLCMTDFCISENATVKNAKFSPDTVDKLLLLHYNYFCGDR